MKGESRVGWIADAQFSSIIHDQRADVYYGQMVLIFVDEKGPFVSFDGQDDEWGYSLATTQLSSDIILWDLVKCSPVRRLVFNRESWSCNSFCTSFGTDQIADIWIVSTVQDRPFLHISIVRTFHPHENR